MLFSFRFFSFAVLLLLSAKVQAQTLFKVGATGGTHTTIAAAYAACTNNTIDYIIEIQSNYNINEASTGSITLNANTAKTITIRPQATNPNFLFSTGITAPLFNINGASNVTIDGRPGGTGTNLMILQNTSTQTGATGGSVIYFTGASKNTIQYCILQGANPNTGSTSGGVICFKALGSDLNTIDNCSIQAVGTSKPAVAIVSRLDDFGAGSNNSITISNCKILDFTSKGIWAANPANTGWRILNNSFYQTAGFTPISDIEMINIGNGSGYLISGNFIGGQAPNCGGSPYNFSNGYVFKGIYFANSQPGTSTIQNNTIQNIIFSGNNFGSVFAFNGIYLKGAADFICGGGIGKENTIGSLTTANSISFTNNATGGNAGFVAIKDSATGTQTISYNNIGGIQVYSLSSSHPAVMINNAAGTTTIDNNKIGSSSALINNTGNATMTLINNTSPSQCIVSNNTIQGVSSTNAGFLGINSSGFGTFTCTANNLSSISSAGNLVYGITSSGAGAFTATNNIIQGVTLSAAVSSSFIGIGTTSAGAGLFTCTGNSINNISSATSNGIINGCIHSLGTGSSMLISQNTISNVSFTNTASANTINTAIYLSVSSANGGTVSKNTITKFFNSSISASAKIVGIELTGGSWTLANNVALLDNSSGNTIIPIYGIDLTSSAGNSSVYYNTIKLYGTQSGTLGSYAIGGNSTAGTFTIKNNIFQNLRSGGTGIHFSENYPNGPTITSNYNYLETNTPTTICRKAGANYSFASWQSFMSAFQSVTGTTAIDAFGKVVSAPFAGASKGTASLIPAVSDDMNGLPRSATAPWMGAYEGLEILTGALTGPLCGGDVITVPYTLNGTFPTPYSLTAQLSDAAGSFGTPTPIGSTTVTGPINATIPAGISTTGTGYRIRVVSASPAVIGVDNGANITINPLPKVTPTTPSAICSGTSTSITLTSTPASTSFSWGNPISTPAGAITGGGPGGGSTITQTLTNATNTSATLTYAVTVNVNGCVSPVENIIQTVHPLPTVNSASTTICSGNAISIPLTSPTGGATFSWPAPISGGAITGGAAGSGLIINQTLINTTTSPANITYSVTATYSTCSGLTQNITATVNPTPTVVITSPASVCSPNTIDLSAGAITAGSTPGLTFTYWTDAAATSALGSYTAVATSGTYYIKGTTTPGCFDIKPVTVNINPKPTVITNTPAAACSPNTVDLTATAVTAGSTAGLVYSYWMDATATTALGSPASVAVSGTYYIKGTTAPGCFDIRAVTVTINPKPTVIITNPSAVCSPSTINLTAGAVTAGSTAGLIYSYYTNAAATISLGTPSAVTTSGTYYIKGITAAGCTDTTAVTVIINPKPTVVTVTPASVCSPATVDLTAASVTTGSTAGLLYAYYTNAGATLLLGSPASVGTSGTYYVKGTTAAGCSDTTAVSVNILPKPTVVTTNPSAVCSPATVNLTLAAVTTGSTVGLVYAYYTNAAATTLLGSPGVVGTSGTYYIKGTTAAGCTDTTAVTVTINPKPTVVTTNPATVCSPLTVDLTAAAVTTGSTAGLIYTYWTNAAATTSLGSPAAVTISGTYYIKGVTTPGCSDTTAVSVTINPKPTVVTVNPAAVCSPSTIDLTAAAVTTGSTAGLIYSYYTNAAATTVLGTPSAVSTSGTYYIKGVATGGCSDTTAVTVTVNPKPTVVITNPAAVCSPLTIDLTAAAITTGSTAGLIYTYWTDAAATISLGSPAAVTTSGIYYIKGTTTPGCIDIKPVTVTINPKPTVVITNPAAVCSPATIDLTAAAVTTGSTAGLIYSYYTNAAATTSLGSPAAVTASGTYYIKGVATGGCSDTTAVTITINPKPTVVTTNPAAVCSPATVNLTLAAVTTGSTAGLIYSYYTNAAATTVLGTPSAVATSGTYYIKGVATGGCSDTTAVTVTVNPKPTVVTTNPATLCSPATVDLTAAAVTAGSTAGLTYSYWTNATATTALGTPATVTASGTYYIRGFIPATGCSDTTAVTVTIISKPIVVTTNPAAVCSPATVNLTLTAVTTGSTGGLVYSYYTNAAATTVLGTPSAVATSGTYYIKGVATGGCSDTTAVTVTINPKPTVVTTNPAAVCSPATVNLTLAAVTTGSTAGLIYSYYTNAAATTSLGSPAAVTTSGTYYIKGVTTLGCTDTTAVSVTINPKPTVVTVNPAAVCSPATIDLTAAAVTSGSTAGLIYSYYTNATATTSLGTPSAVTTSGTYYIKGVATGGCSDTTAVTVTVNPKPTVVITNPAAVCSPASIDLTAAAVTTGSTGGLTYSYWTNAAATAGLGTPAAVVASGTYYIKGTTTPGCIDIKPVTIVINPMPTVNAGPDISACNGGAAIPLNGTATNTASNQWVTSGTGSFSNSTALSATYTPSTADETAGQTKLILRGSAPTCANVTDTLVINYTTSPSINAGADAAICANATITLNATGASGNWTGGLGTYSPNASSSTATYTPTPAEISSGSLTLTISSLAGLCPVVSDQVTFTFKPVPSVNTVAPVTVCSGSSTSISLASTPSGATFSWTSTTVSGSVTGAGSGNVNSIAQTLSGNGDINYNVIPTLNGCVGAALTIDVTVSSPVMGPLSTSLGTASNGIAYTQTFTVTNMSSPVWTSSGTPPPGLALSAGGILSGTPSSNGAFNFDIIATEGACTVSKTYTLTISGSATTWNGTGWDNNAPNASTDAIINGNYSTSINGAFNCKNLTVNNGTTFTIDGTTTVTIGGNLTNSGTISQKCTATLTVTGTKSGNAVSIIQPVLNPTSLAPGVINTLYGQAIPFTVNFGSPVFTASGLPSGLSILPGSNKISGTPSVAGNNTVIVTATEGNCIVSNTMNLQIDLKNPILDFLQKSTVTKTYGDADFNLLAISSSSAPIVYSISPANNGCITVNSTTGTIHINCVPPTPVHIVATQTSTFQYKAGIDSLMIKVNKAVPQVTLLSLPGILKDSTELFDFLVSPTGTYTASFIQLDGQQFAYVDTTGNITGISAGAFKIKLSLTASTNYEAFETIYNFNVFDSLQPPIAVPDTIYLTRKDGSIGDGTIDLLKNDNGVTSRVQVYLTDIDTVNQGHQNIFYAKNIGTFDLDPVTGILTVHPTKGLTGKCQISYTITDSSGKTSPPAHLTIIIINKQDLPDIKANQVMTPNDDGKNDALFIGYTDINKNNRIVILDEAGNTVYKTSNYRNDWVGTDNNGNLLAAGVYYFVFTEEEDQNRELKGYIEIIRRSHE